MDDKETKNIFDAAASVALTEKERAVLRRVISAYVFEHPRRLQDERETRHSAWFVSWNMFLRPLPAALLATFLIGAGSSVSFAAERSLPGDMLWPVKVSINENVRLAVAFSPEAKAEWEARRVLRRIEEAEEMVRDVSFGTEARISIELHLDDHAERVRFRITKLTAKGKVQAAAELSSNFEAALRAHGSILADLVFVASTTRSGERDDIEELRKSVNSHKKNASSERSETEEKLSADADASRVAAEARMRSALKKIGEVRIFITRREPVFTANTIADAEARLAVALNMVADGKAKLDGGKARDAFRLFQQAHRIAEEARLLMDVRQNLNIDIQLDAPFDGSEDSGKGEHEIEKSEEENSMHDTDDDRRGTGGSSGRLRPEKSAVSRAGESGQGISGKFRVNTNP